MVLGALALTGIGLYADFGETVDALAAFDWAWLPVALGLVSLNYVLRFARWHWYVRRLEIELPVVRSLSIFLAGMSMTVSPGKLGEAVKSVLLRRSFSIPLSRSAPIVLAERVTDLFGVALLAGLAAAAVRTTANWPVFAVGLGAAIFVTAVARTSLPFRVLRVPDAHASSALLLSLRPLVLMSLLATASWFCECLAAYVCLSGLGLSASLPEAVLIFALATLAGAVSFVPGGLGVAEASMTGLLRVLIDAPRAGAAAATVLIRAITLWFAVIVGLVALAVEARVGAVRAVRAYPDPAA